MIDGYRLNRLMLKASRMILNAGEKRELAYLIAGGHKPLKEIPTYKPRLKLVVNNKGII